MRALADRHQADLFYSLQRLLEDRLGIEVWTPVGHDWWDAGYWRFGEGYGDDRLARQFLDLGPWLPTPDPGTWITTDPHHPERKIRGIERFAVLPGDWSFVVATVQDNQRGFARLAREIGAQYVYQVGNTRQEIDWSLFPLVLSSSEVPLRYGITYHQEFDAETTFRFRKPRRRETVRSFVNCFPSTPCHRLLEEARRHLPGFTVAVHGIDGPDGNVETARQIAELMAWSGWGWHDKVQGDGFGHIIHQWAAVGRPLIGHAFHYEGLMAEPFWEDGVTSINLDRRTIPEAMALIREITDDPPRHRAMCEAIRARFDELVDYDAEAARIRGALL